MNRTVDFVIAALAIALLSPVLLPIIAILRLTGEGEVFYKQERVGRGGRRFFIYKFATMLKDSPSLSGGDITISGDPRILPFGRFLRNTKINELPQLLNVLTGDMSLVGWRPLTPRVAALFPAEHWRALGDSAPGLSGLASIAFRDEEGLLHGIPNREQVYASAIVPYKSALEIWYVKHQNLYLDATLMFLTLAAVAKMDVDLYRTFKTLPEPPPELIALRSREQSRPSLDQRGEALHPGGTGGRLL